MALVLRCNWMDCSSSRSRVTGGVAVVGGVVAGLKKLCKGVSEAVPGLVSGGRLHL